MLGKNNNMNGWSDLLNTAANILGQREASKMQAKLQRENYESQAKYQAALAQREKAAAENKKAEILKYGLIIGLPIISIVSGLLIYKITKKRKEK